MDNKFPLWPREGGLTPRIPQPGMRPMTDKQRSMVRAQVKKGRKVYL